MDSFQTPRTYETNYWQEPKQSQNSSPVIFDKSKTTKSPNLESATFRFGESNRNELANYHRENR